MKKLLVIALLISCGTLSAQNGGYGDKNFNLRLDLLEGRHAAFSGVHMEYIFYRIFSVSLGYKKFSRSIEQSYNKGEYPVSNNSIYGYNIFNELDNARLNVSAYELELRIYPKDRWSLPAPNGFFHYSNFRYGQIDVKGSFYEELVNPSPPQGPFNQPANFNGNLVKYEYKNIDFLTMEMGVGYQKLINKRVSFGGKIGLNYTTIMVDNPGIAENVLSGVTKKYGSNLLSITNGSSNSPTKSNIGISAGLQIGVLLY